MGHKVELLAPAGNMEGFYGAVHAGADAVYLGGEKFGARAYADNFTAGELLTCVRYAHLWGRRVYLTVNTLVKENETDELLRYLAPLYEHGLDGVIVQDIGVFSLIRRYFPGLKLHVSTQMTVTGGYGARLLADMGADRIVPARELGLDEIVELKRASGLEVETFIHGAMCYCYSGQCLFSSILGGRSGNRGRCAQPCRLPYRVARDLGVTEECYPLSLKDLCTVERLPELIDAGIDSFKIEGRMKKPEYAAGVTAFYRSCIDRYCETGELTDVDTDALTSLYIRSEKQTGYYFQRNGREMVTLDNPSYSRNDEAYLNGIRERYIEQRPTVATDCDAEFRVGRPARLTLTAERRGEKLRVTAEGEPVQAAERQPITRENIERQLGKLGDTIFVARRMNISLDENVFYPLKEINALRRSAVALLEDALIEMNAPARAKGGPMPENGIPQRKGAEEDAPRITERGIRWHLSVRTAGQLAAVLDDIKQSEYKKNTPVRIYLESDLLTDHYENGSMTSLCHELQSLGCEPVIALPCIIRWQDREYLERLWAFYECNQEVFAGFLARSVDGLGFLRERRGKLRPAVYGDAGLYVWNLAAMRTWSAEAGEFGLDGFCMPYELRASDQHRLLDAACMPCEKVVYGRIPLMVTANCVANTIDGCRRESDDRSGNARYELTDRLNKRFPVVRDCRHCMNIIYNCVPLSLHGEMAKWPIGLRLDFTVEDADETRAVLRYFLGGAGGMPPYRDYTTGHEKRGAE